MSKVNGIGNDLIATQIYKNRLTEKESVANSPERKGMKSMHCPNGEETGSSQAEICPDSECCLREKHDFESSNFDATRKSLVKMKKNRSSQCDNAKWAICQMRSD
jgi:hypothetical protein